MPTFRRMAGCLLVVNAFQATKSGHGFNRAGVFLLNILRHKADLCAVIAFFILKLVNRLTVECLTNGRNIFLHALIRSCLLGCSGRTGQSASAFSDTRQVLPDLEGITLLLQELVVKSRFARLCSLLLLLTSSHLGLSSRNLSRLVLHTKISGIHTASLRDASRLSCIAKNVLANASSGLRTLKPLRELLIAKPLNGLTLCDILTK